MKHAKREADELIAKLRAEKTAEFEATSQATSTKDEFAELKMKTDADIAAMKDLFATNKGNVINMIVNVVTDVDLTLSETRKLAGQRISGQV